MNEVLKVIEASDKLNTDITDKASEVEQLKKRQETFEADNATKLKELQTIQENLSMSQEDQDDLSIRNEALREKFIQIDENVKKEANEISNELKILCKRLGIKVTVESMDHESQISFSLSFTESRSHKVTLVYDSITEDYDLLNIEPKHPRFQLVKTFLWQTKDIQGFLGNYRSKILSDLNNGECN